MIYTSIKSYRYVIKKISFMIF